MNKKNIVCNTVSETAKNNRTVYNPMQFLEKIAETDCEKRGRGINRNYHYLEVADQVVENKNMEDTEFHFSKLSNVKFENCEFEGTEFKGVEFNHVSFSHCKMENVSFDFAQLNEVCFTECFLDGSEFDFSSGTASFSSCSMGCTEFPMAAIELTFTKCNLHHAELNGILNLRLHAKESDFSRAEFNNSIMEGSAENCIFSNSEFYGTNGKKLQFTGCRFHNISTEGSVGIEENEEINDEFDVDEELEELFNE